VYEFPSKRDGIYFEQKDIRIAANKMYKLSFCVKSSENITYGAGGASKSMLIRAYYNNGANLINEFFKYVEYYVPLITFEKDKWVRIEGFLSTENFNLTDSKFTLKFFLGSGVKNTREPVNIYFSKFHLAEI